MIAIADTELLKQIMVKESDIFTDRGFVVSNLHVYTILSMARNDALYSQTVVK